VAVVPNGAARGRGSDQLAMVKSAPLSGMVPVTVNIVFYRTLFKQSGCIRAPDGG